MDHFTKEENHSSKRRQRIHELLIALIRQQDSLSLMDAEKPISELQSNSSLPVDPGAWLDRNRRVLHTYQSLIRSAVTLDALMDAEQAGIGTNSL